jgi:hypothetical protein
MNKELSIGRLLVSQRELTGVEPMTVNYDLIISAISWESRNVTSFERLGELSAPTIFFRFKSSKPEIDLLKDINEEKLKALCPSNTIILLDKSIDFDANSEVMDTALRDAFVRKKSPLRVLLDITCMPKSYMSFICGLGFTNDYFCRLDCTYAEGKYDFSATAATSGPISIFSEGEWASQQIPYLEANDMFSAERDLLVIMGGEIGYSLPFIERYEPSRLGVIFIKGTYNPEDFVGSEQTAYADLTSEPTLLRADYPIEDMISVLQNAHDFCRGSDGKNIAGLAIGSKSQSLGLALAALDIENLEIICRIPSSYTNSEVLPTGRVFYYCIEDRFEPMGYLD